MNRLMLDYFWRWRWVLLAAGLLELRLGWQITKRPADPFEFWAFLVAVWCGATLLSFDLRRGALRSIAVLPLKARQIGRSWWLATVPIPAVALATLLFLGAGACCHFYPDKLFPMRQLIMASLFALVWLGIGFTMIFNATRGLGGGCLEVLFNSATSLLCMALFFGSMLLNQGMANSPWRVALLLGVGAVLTGVGWMRAEQFDPGRAWLFLGRPGQPDVGRLSQPGAGRTAGRLTPLELKEPPGNCQVAGGYGGVAFLINSSTLRSFTVVAAMIALMLLISLGQQQALPENLALRVLIQTGSFLACGFILLYQLLPVLRQVRLLRTLPISTTRLAGVLIALIVLPLLAVGALASVVVWPLLGASVAVVFLKSYAFILAPGALCVFFALWRGEGVMGYAMMLGILFGFLKVQGWLVISMHTLDVPFGVIAAIAVAGVALGYLFTRQALGHSSHAYRGRTNLAGSFPWNGGR
jgi:hypothetical protein